MRRKTLVIALLAPLIAMTASAHDLFLRLDSYFLSPNSKATVRLLNGTFQRSDGAVARERLADVSLYAPDLPRPSAELISWRTDEKTSIMEIQTGSRGTYLVSISLPDQEK